MHNDILCSARVLQKSQSVHYGVKDKTQFLPGDAAKSMDAEKIFTKRREKIHAEMMSSGDPKYKGHDRLKKL